MSGGERRTRLQGKVPVREATEIGSENQMRPVIDPVEFRFHLASPAWAYPDTLRGYSLILRSCNQERAGRVPHLAHGRWGRDHSGRASTASITS
jgi:hypothetical protein